MSIILKLMLLTIALINYFSAAQNVKPNTGSSKTEMAKRMSRKGRNSTDKGLLLKIKRNRETRHKSKTDIPILSFPKNWGDSCLPEESDHRWLLAEISHGGFSNMLFGIYSYIPVALLYNATVCLSLRVQAFCAI